MGVWLRHPTRDDIADWIERPSEIEERASKGWIEIPPKWIKVRSTGVVHFVTHPEHQKRLLADGGTIVYGPDGETLHESDLPKRAEIDIEAEIDQRVSEKIEEILARLGLNGPLTGDFHDSPEITMLPNTRAVSDVIPTAKQPEKKPVGRPSTK